MKIAIVADSHFDEHSRFDECRRIHDWIAEDAQARGVTLTLHAGDIFERRSTPRERSAVASWVRWMAQLGPVIVARGNHDSLDDLPLLEQLATRHTVHVVESCAVLPCEGVTVGVLGWPQRGRIHAALAAQGVTAPSSEHVEASAHDALRAVLRGLGDQMAQHATPRVLLAHAMVRGSVTSTGQPLVGCDFELGIEDLALARADLYALGHIHKGQRWAIDDAPVVYPGSPRRTNFGEIEAKGYTVASFDGARLVGLEFVECPATRMIHLDAAWCPEFEGASPPRSTFPAALIIDMMLESEICECRGAEVRLRYTVPISDREAAKRAAESKRDEILRDGATSVKLEEVVLTEQRARSPEVAAATTLAAKLEAFWAAKSFDPGARRDKMIAKLEEVSS